MSRVQLALNVDDIDEAVAFYSKLFATGPAKTRPGYANFAIAEPPLKLVLLENPGKGGTLNHLGVEVTSTEQVTAATVRLAGEGLATATEDEVTCCYAVQDKVWVDDPNGAPWEIYTVLADAEPDAGGPVYETRTTDGACGPGSCGTTAAASASGAIPVAASGNACCAG
jgi:catechol 2,3-dioxygenase-like lactoylglutathione lyase family enzyme